MSNPFEFTAAQNLVPALRADGPRLPWWLGGGLLWKGYQLPLSDVGADRPLDKSRVGRIATEIAFPRHPGVSVGLPSDQTRWKAHWNNAKGQPLQEGDPSRTMTVKVRERVWVGDRLINTGNYLYEAEVPAPRAGFLWVQGNPQPTPSLAGWSDTHAYIVNPDGSSTEMIGVQTENDRHGTVVATCAGLGRFDRDGHLTDPRDRHVTVWKPETAQDGPAGRVTPLILGRSEAAHRLAMVIPGDDRNTDTLDEIGLWVALPEEAVPWAYLKAFPDAERIARMLVNHGAMTIDHGGHADIVEVAGAEWAGVNFGGWAPSLDQFRRVVTAA